MMLPEAISLGHEFKGKNLLENNSEMRFLQIHDLFVVSKGKEADKELHVPKI